MLFFILEKCILIDDDSKLFGLIRIYGENIWWKCLLREESEGWYWYLNRV